LIGNRIADFPPRRRTQSRAFAVTVQTRTGFETPLGSKRQLIRPVSLALCGKANTPEWQWRDAGGKGVPGFLGTPSVRGPLFMRLALCKLLM
jgi:hypothetical protein